MKKSVTVIIVITLIVTLIGCSTITQNVTTQPNSTLDSKKEIKYTKEDAVAVFKAGKDIDNYQIIDCVLMDDNKIQMLKAVISFYDKKKNNGNNLAFVFGDQSQEIYFAKNEVEGVETYKIVDGSHLSYIGNGAVVTSIRKIETNEIYDYTVTFSYEEPTSTTNIKIVSVKRTK